MFDDSYAMASNLGKLIQDLSEWSQATFGADSGRGPVGPLKHLEKEAREAQENPYDILEYADILILLLDSSRRAGFTFEDLIYAGLTKMKINRARKWPKSTDPNAPVEHDRSSEKSGSSDYL